MDGCRAVLDAAEAGQVLIVTSALTIAEVLAMRGRQPVSANVRDAVKAFFRRDYIAVENVSRRIAESARDFVWDYGVDPKDALHVATAVASRVDQFNTFDVKLLKKSGVIGSPPLLIQKPFMRQGTLPLGGNP